jgi:hypothetical protein
MVGCKRPEPWGVPTGGFAGGLSHAGRNSIVLIALCRWATKGVIMPREIVEPHKGEALRPAWCESPVQKKRLMLDSLSAGRRSKAR